MKKIKYIALILIAQSSLLFAFEPNFSVLKKSPKCLILRGNLNYIDPIENKEVELTFFDYRPRKIKHNPTIIVPPTGGLTILDRGYAKSLCSKGSRALMLDRFYQDAPEGIRFEKHQESLIRGPFAILKLAEILNSDQYNLLGTSLGGIYVGIALGEDPHAKKAVIIASGNRLANTLAYSELSALTQLKNERFKVHNFKNNDDYEQYLNQFISIDAENYKNELIKKDIYQIVAKKDTIVPYSNQLYFNKMANVKKTDVLSLDHKPTIVLSGIFYKSKIVDFLTR